MFARIALFVLMGLGLAGFGVVAWINLHPTFTAGGTVSQTVVVCDKRPRSLFKAMAALVRELAVSLRPDGPGA